MRLILLMNPFIQNSMLEKVTEIFKDEFILQSTVDEIIIDLSEKGEDCKIKLTGGQYIELRDGLVESLGNKLLKGKLGENCDAIILNKSEENINLFLIEYKNNIGFKNFEKICNQLNATYVKTLALINIVFKIEDINVIYVCVGKIHEKAQKAVLSSKTNKPNLLNQLVRKGETSIKEIPFRLGFSVNDSFRKSNVNFVHSECGTTSLSI